MLLFYFMFINKVMSFNLLMLYRSILLQNIYTHYSQHRNYLKTRYPTHSIWSNGTVIAPRYLEHGMLIGAQ